MKFNKVDALKENLDEIKLEKVAGIVVIYASAVFFEKKLVFLKVCFLCIRWIYTHETHMVVRRQTDNIGTACK